MFASMMVILPPGDLIEGDSSESEHEPHTNPADEGVPGATQFSTPPFVEPPCFISVNKDLL